MPARVITAYLHACMRFAYWNASTTAAATHCFFLIASLSLFASTRRHAQGADRAADAVASFAKAIQLNRGELLLADPTALTTPPPSFPYRSFCCFHLYPAYPTSYVLSEPQRPSSSPHHCFIHPLSTLAALHACPTSAVTEMTLGFELLLATLSNMKQHAAVARREREMNFRRISMVGAQRGSEAVRGEGNGRGRGLAGDK